MAATSVPTTGIRYEITADASKFAETLAQAQALSRKAGDKLGEAFEAGAEAATTAVDSFSTRAMLKVLAVVGAVVKVGGMISDAWTGGAQGAEQAVTNAFEAIKGKTNDLIGDFFRARGKVATAFYEIFQGAFKRGIDAAGAGAAGLLDRLLPSQERVSQFATQYRDAIIAANRQVGEVLGLTGEQMATSNQNAEALANTFAQRLPQAMEGARRAIQQIAGTFEGVSREVEEAVKVLDRTIAEQEELNETIGGTAGERAQVQAKIELLRALKSTWEDLNDAEQAYVNEALTRRAAVAQDAENRRQAIAAAREQQRAIESIVTSLQRETEFERQAAQALRQTAGERARERAEAMVRGFRSGTGARVEDDPAVQAAIAQRAADAQVSASIRLNLDSAEALRQQSDAYHLQARAVGLSAGEVAKMKFVQDQLNAAQRAGVPVTAEMRSMWESMGTALGMAAQAATQAQERLRALQEVGRTVTQSLEQAFSRFMEGTKFKWKDFVDDLQRDLAKLAVRQGLQQLIGTGTGSNPFGALGSLFSLLPKFASGGNVAGGAPIVVGEKGPELFVPKSAGTVVPNSGLARSGGGTSITVQQVFQGPIDASMRAYFQSMMQQTRDDAVRIALQSVPQEAQRRPGYLG